jgi:hypothetical protein
VQVAEQQSPEVVLPSSQSSCGVTRPLPQQAPSASGETATRLIPVVEPSPNAPLKPFPQQRIDPSPMTAQVKTPPDDTSRAIEIAVTTTGTL